MLFARSVVLGGGPAFDLLMEGFVEGGLGAAALKRRMRGGYGLVLVALIDVLLAVRYRAAEEATTRSFILLVYGVGAYSLRQTTVRRPRRRLRIAEKLSGRS